MCKKSRIFAFLLFFLTACSPSSEPSEDPGNVGSVSQEDQLDLQASKLEDLRETHGVNHPKTLAELARLIRARAARGDVETGAALFDELLDLDLRSSPALAHLRPPVEYVRLLGSLGELDAASLILAKHRSESQSILGANDLFVLRVSRAQARLLMAIGRTSEGIALLEEVAARLRQAFGAEHPMTQTAKQEVDEAQSRLDGRKPSRPPAEPSQAVGGQDLQKTIEDSVGTDAMAYLTKALAEAGVGIDPTDLAEIGVDINFSERGSIGQRDWGWEILPDSFEGRAERELTKSMHRHFDQIVDMSVKHGFEKAESLRAFPTAYNLSLVTRIRRPEKTHDDGAQPAESSTGSSVSEIEETALLMQAVTRALDRLPASDSRFELLREERQRLYQQRNTLLNEARQFIEEIYRSPTLASVQEVLRLDATAMLYYLCGDDHTDLLVISPGHEAAQYRLPIGLAALEAEVAQVLANRNEVYIPRGATLIEDQATDEQSTPRGATLIEDEATEEQSGQAAAERLYSILVSPAREQLESVDRIVVVPDGPLYELPFAALRRTTADGNQEFLVEWKPFHTAPSAAIYLALVAKRPEHVGNQLRGTLVAFGGPSYERLETEEGSLPLPFSVRSAGSRGFSGELKPLPGSRLEVEQISQMFKDEGLPSLAFLGSEANEANAKKMARDATFLHFAVHGIQDIGQPQHSYLALSLPSSIVEGEDNGILEGWEVIDDDLSLSAELVALSACDTALGRQLSGEGPTSLNRAFLAAGARSVLATLWPVDDQATAILMPAFYRHLLSGKAKDEALHLAQLELLDHGDAFKAPTYWAGFQLTGDWR